MSTAARVEAEIVVTGTRLQVVGYELERRLSAVDRLWCRAMAPAGSLPDGARAIGSVAHFSIKRLSDDSVCAFTGEVVEASCGISAEGTETLVVVVQPRLWRLGARRGHRVFRQQSVQDIVSTLLGEAGLSASQQEWRLTAPLPARPYVAQHQETDLDFVLRLLSEEGVYFTCVYEGQEEARLLFGDDPGGWGSNERGPAELPFVPSFGEEGLRDAVANVRRTQRVRPARVTARDYDPERPSLAVEGDSTGTAPDEALETYTFPARVTEPADAARRATLQREALEADRIVLEGETGTLSLDPGFSFELFDHPYPLMNGECTVRALTYSGSSGRQFGSGAEGGHERHVCRFEAVPIRSAVRPRYVPPARVAPGIQLAVTVGRAGEEIYTDERGRVTAQFLWDREGQLDDNASCWMRTSQVPTGGAMLLPRVGWEVAVRYAEGDVDQPLVLERLYNGRTPPPYALPANAARSSIQTATTPGGGSSNELRLSDVKGEEQVFLNASKDMSVQIGNNTTVSVGNDLSVSVGSNQTSSVLDSVSSTVGGSQTLSVGASQTCSVGTLMVEDIGGTHSLAVGANRNHSIGGDHRRTVDGNSSLEVGGNEMNLVVGDVSETCAAALSHTVGAALIQMCGGDRSLVVGGARSETTGAAKVILAKGNRGVEAGLMSTQTGGALMSQVKGDSSESATIAYTETVAGATTVSAKNVVVEATALLSVTMGGANITLTPASISISGASVKLDGNVVETGIVIDN